MQANQIKIIAGIVVGLSVCAVLDVLALNDLRWPVLFSTAMIALLLSYLFKRITPNEGD